MTQSAATEERAAAEQPAGFAALLREATAREHQQAEQSAFMGDLLGGRLGVAAYAALAGQLWFVYRELERAGEELAEHPVVGPFIDPALYRAPELERDLRHLCGPGWREGLAALPATEAYTARLREVARDWPQGLLAHHYTRYLGDLSGGQIIRGIAEKTWGFERKGDGVRFYVFEAVGNPAAFKRDYRARLDAAGELLGAAGQRRVAEEACYAFRLNTGLFAGLGDVHRAAA
jgi:heme oxygenase